ncbi:MAG: hypothetical protein ACRES8_04605 [Nevskiaceae bacterium]
MASARHLGFVAIVLLALPPPAAARDDQRLFDLAPALASPEGRDRFDDTIAFHWSEAETPPIERSFAVHTSERRTFLPTRTEREACDQSFIEALAGLRDAARKAGADAVVAIKSLHKNREFRSTTQYECRLSYFSATVTLEGRVVKLAPPGPVTTPVPPSAPETPEDAPGFQPG